MTIIIYLPVTVVIYTISTDLSLNTKFLFLTGVSMSITYIISATRSTFDPSSTSIRLRTTLSWSTTCFLWSTYWLSWSTTLCSVTCPCVTTVWCLGKFVSTTHGIYCWSPRCILTYIYWFGVTCSWITTSATSLVTTIGTGLIWSVATISCSDSTVRIFTCWGASCITCITYTITIRVRLTRIVYSYTVILHIIYSVSV